MSILGGVGAPAASVAQAATRAAKSDKIKSVKMKVKIKISKEPLPKEKNTSGSQL